MVLPCSYHLVIILRVKEKQPLPLPLFFNFCLLLSSADDQRITAPFPTTRWMYEGVIFPRHNIYIYIYIYMEVNCLVKFYNTEKNYYLGNSRRSIDLLRNKVDTKEFWFKWTNVRTRGDDIRDVKSTMDV